jgi:hypothetical protein
MSSPPHHRLALRILQGGYLLRLYLCSFSCPSNINPLAFSLYPINKVVEALFLYFRLGEPLAIYEQDKFIIFTRSAGARTTPLTKIYSPKSITGGEVVVFSPWSLHTHSM